MLHWLIISEKHSSNNYYDDYSYDNVDNDNGNLSFKFNSNYSEELL